MNVVKGRVGALTVGALVVLAYSALIWQQLRSGIEYDEGSNLSVVVNLGSGQGYTSSGLLPWMWSKPFDPGASTGPALLIPGSLLWHFSGGSLEAARVVPVMFFLVLAVGLGLLFGRLAGRWAGLIAASSPLLLSVGKEDISTVSLVPGRFVGEIAATAGLALMAWLLSASGGRRSWIIWVLAGVAGGLAIQSKIHFLLPVAVLAGVWFVLEWIAGRRPPWLVVVLVIGGLLLPTALFEVYRLVSLGSEGYLASIKDLAQWLIGQGSTPDTTPFMASAGRRLGGLLSMFSLSGAILLAAAASAVVLLALAGHRTGMQAMRSDAQSRAVTSVLALVASAGAIFVWWMFWPPEKLPRVGIPVLLVVAPVLLVAAYVSVFRRWNADGAAAPERRVVRVVGGLLAVTGLLVLASQAWTAATNDFGARMLAEQRAAAQVIADSGTPSLPMEWIWNLAQFQILSGVPSETKPGVSAPTVDVYDSIRARVDYGVDDARAFIPTCERVLYSSQSSVVCARTPE